MTWAVTQTLVGHSAVSRRGIRRTSTLDSFPHLCVSVQSSCFKMHGPALVLAIVCFASYTLAATITDCNKPDSVGKLTKVDVSDCTEEDRVCALKRGTNASITIEFETTKEVEKLKHEVHGVIRGLAVPFRLPNEDACVDTGLTCPLAVGSHKYQYDLFVKTTYPQVKVTVRWQLKDAETNNDVICIEIPAHVR